MGFNLTNEPIQDTYEQLVQISGSTLVNGLGNVIASITTPTSFATNSDVANEATLVNVISTTTNQNFPVTFVSSNANQQVRIDANTGDFFYNPSTNRLSLSNLTVSNPIVGTLETASFALTASVALTALVATSASHALNANTAISAQTATSSSHALNANTAISAQTATSASFATNANNLDGLDSTAFAQLSLNNNFSGTQNFVNISVSATASVAYLEAVTGSAKIIGDEFIILNAAIPAARYAGLIVYDTGSTPATASFEWDGLTDNWILMEETGDTAVILTGRTGSRGAEVLPTVNRLQKGGGHHQLLDSNITDNGTLVSVSTPFTATQITASSGFKGDLDGNATTATLAATASLAFFADTCSFAVSSISASLALTASSADVFNVRTSLTLDSLVPTFVSSGSSTGSLIDNIHPAIASSSAQIKHIVTITQDQYDASVVSDDTLYVITDLTGSGITINNLTVTGKLDLSGSLNLSGSVSSQVTTLTIASSTASVDLSTSNFFEKSLTAPTFIANPTNAKAGSTYTFQFNSGSLISNFDSDYRFVGGTNPTLSNGQDIVTFVSFLSGSAVKLYGTGLADFQ
jgi:hypothetical protein